MHRNIVLFRDSISSTTKECIFLVGNPCTLYLGLLFFLAFASIDKSWFRYSTVSYWNQETPFRTSLGETGHGRPLEASILVGFFRGTGFQAFRFQGGNLTKGGLWRMGCICYSRRHGRRLQTLDWRKSHLWYNPAPERVGDHLLWVVPGSYVNGLVETIYREIQSLLSLKMIKVKVISQVFLSTKFAICFFSDLDSLRELPYLYIISTTPKLQMGACYIPQFHPISLAILPVLLLILHDITWSYTILHDIHKWSHM